jgi:hypothetical protein
MGRVVELVGWVAKFWDGWLSWLGWRLSCWDGWLCIGSTPACYGSSLGSNPDISQKYIMDDTSKGVAITL